MSDLSANQPAEEATGGAPAPEGGAPPVVEDAAGGQPEEFTPEYVHKLRDENAGYRTELKPFKDTFEGYSPEEVDTFLQVAKALREDPVAAADWFETVASNIKKGMSPEQAEAAATQDVAEAAQSATGGDDKPLTKAEVEQYLQQREATREDEKARTEALESVNKQVRDLGYDPEGSDGLQVMWLAVNKTSGDIEEAHKLVQAERQQIIDTYLEEKRQEAKNAGVTPAHGGIVSGEKQIQTLDDSVAAMKARLSAVQIGTR